LHLLTYSSRQAVIDHRQSVLITNKVKISKQPRPATTQLNEYGYEARGIIVSTKLIHIPNIF